MKSQSEVNFYTRLFLHYSKKLGMHGESFLWINLSSNACAKHLLSSPKRKKGRTHMGTWRIQFQTWWLILLATRENFWTAKRLMDRKWRFIKVVWYPSRCCLAWFFNLSLLPWLEFKVSGSPLGPGSNLSTSMFSWREHQRNYLSLSHPTFCC